MSVINITEKNYEAEVLQSGKTVLLDFWAPWCGACRAVAPAVEAAAVERPDVKVGKVNVDEAGELARAFSVMSIPTLVVLKGGKILNRCTGARSLEQILTFLSDKTI